MKDTRIQNHSIFYDQWLGIFLAFFLLALPNIKAFGEEASDSGVRPQKSSNKPSDPFKTLRSDEGFLFSQLDTSWFNSPTPEDKKDIHLLFRSPQVNKGFQPIMTVRVDRSIGNTKNIREYVQQWMGDYAKLGYQVLGSRPFRHKNETGYVIDVKNTKSNTKKPGKQIRQAVFFKRREKAVILTCIDNISSFRTTLKECNKIIRSFTWASSDTTKKQAINVNQNL